MGNRVVVRSGALTALALGLALGLAAAAHADDEQRSRDGANTTVWKTLAECNTIVGYAEGTAPGCACAEWEKGLPIPAGCNIAKASDQEVKHLMREARALARGVLWLLGYAQTLLALLAGASLLALGAAAYTGALNVQWLAIIALLLVVGAGATSIVSFTGSGYHASETVNLWASDGRPVILKDGSDIVNVEPVQGITIRESDTP